jgi:hypothetical protein
MSLGFFSATDLTDDQKAAWREFAGRVPWAHYEQDPDWAETRRGGRGKESGTPRFFWCEKDGEVCLTAIAIRRRLPVPHGVFWQFGKGPTFLDAEVLDEWLSWLVSVTRRDSARIRMAPAVPLHEGGDETETILERHGFLRRRMLGGWATLRMDLTPDESALMASFRPSTQQRIRKSGGLGVRVEPSDSHLGWATLAMLQAQLSGRAPVAVTDASDIERISRSWLRGGEGGTVLVAFHEDEPLAAALVVIHRLTGYLVMMPSSIRQKEYPTSHLLLWEAIRWAKQHGCARFDLVGYSLVARPGDPLWGVNEFKRGFASLDNVIRFVAFHELVVAPNVVRLAAVSLAFQARLARGRQARAR